MSEGIEENPKRCPYCGIIVMRKSWNFCPRDSNKLEIVEIPEGMSYGEFKKQSDKQKNLENKKIKLKTLEKQIEELERDMNNSNEKMEGEA